MNARQVIQPDTETGVGFDASKALAAWRARGAADADPVGLCITEAMVRRAEGLQGRARALLEERIEQRLAGLEPQLAVHAPAAPASQRAAPSAAQSLRQLVERLSRSPSAEPGPSPAAPAPASAPRPLNALAAHKGTWSRLRAEQRLRQALAQVPSMAGPLNSSQMVHRALQAMRDLSPAYLDAFMAHIDTLLWLEQASGGDLPVRTGGAARGNARR
jgi:hypothetical protein